MTIDDFKYLVAVKKELEFSHNGKVYTLNYASDKDGSYITFGRLYDRPARFSDVGELLNEVKLENHFLREVIQDIPRP